MPYYKLVTSRGSVQYFHVLACAELFQRQFGGTVSYSEYRRHLEPQAA